ncbi:MAG TPA: glutamate--tRNA ligase family protein, partial [Planctomycetota bacterium]|nr:glutamate--tRNA ligase family protein [Planctomycetota bacterium]
MVASGTRCVGRLAPSPTGALHLGNARTFLLAWLSI